MNDITFSTTVTAFGAGDALTIASQLSAFFLFQSGQGSKQEASKEIKDANKILAGAIKYAEDQLKDKDKCRQLFGNPRTGSDPVTVLEDLRGSHTYGSLPAVSSSLLPIDGATWKVPSVSMGVRTITIIHTARQSRNQNEGALHS